MMRESVLQGLGAPLDRGTEIYCRNRNSRNALDLSCDGVRAEFFLSKIIKCADRRRRQAHLLRVRRLLDVHHSHGDHDQLFLAGGPFAPSTSAAASLVQLILAPAAEPRHRGAVFDLIGAALLPDFSLSSS